MPVSQLMSADVVLDAAMVTSTGAQRGVVPRASAMTVYVPGGNLS
jgi:hypothetical protein